MKSIATRQDEIFVPQISQVHTDVTEDEVQFVHFGEATDNADDFGDFF